MMGSRFFGVILLLAACAVGSASCFGESFRLRAADTLKVHYCEACLEYASPGLRKPRQTATARLRPTPAPGHTTSFHIVVDYLTGTSDTLAYFTFLQTPRESGLMTSLRLVFFVDGTSEWEYHVGGEPFSIGPSNISAGNGDHTVTFMASSDGYVVVEDGKVVGSVDRAITDLITPSFDLTLNDRGATVRTALTEMTFQRGFDTPPPIAPA